MKIPVSYWETGDSMIVNIKIAEMVLQLIADRELEIDREFAPFLASPSCAADMTVKVSWNWENSDILRSEPLGRDLLLLYYRENGYCYCEMDGADRGAIAQVRYSPDFSEIRCTINTRDFHVPQNTVRQILRMLPIRQMLLHHNILFLHASQVMHQNRAIVFSAPSGTGKTTQAKLWQQHRNAEILCNDRTLLKKSGGEWLTYSYPYDGSEPIQNSKTGKLACITLLRQSQEDQIIRLSPIKAITQLLPQTVIDTWDPASRSKAIGLIADIYEAVPIYQLDCTVSQNAVSILEEALEKEK